MIVTSHFGAAILRRTKVNRHFSNHAAPLFPMPARVAVVGLKWVVVRDHARASINSLAAFCCVLRLLGEFWHVRR
jgi:hypothetical protein